MSFYLGATWPHSTSGLDSNARGGIGEDTGVKGVTRHWLGGGKGDTIDTRSSECKILSQPGSLWNPVQVFVFAFLVEIMPLLSTFGS